MGSEGEEAGSKPVIKGRGKARVQKLTRVNRGHGERGVCRWVWKKLDTR